MKQWLFVAYFATLHVFNSKVSLLQSVRQWRVVMFPLVVEHDVTLYYDWFNNDQESTALWWWRREVQFPFTLLFLGHSCFFLPFKNLSNPKTLSPWFPTVAHPFKTIQKHKTSADQVDYRLCLWQKYSSHSLMIHIKHVRHKMSFVILVLLHGMRWFCSVESVCCGSPSINAVSFGFWYSTVYITVM